MSKMILIDEATVKLALEALESCGWNDGYAGENQYFHDELVDKAITALREALAEQPAQQEKDWGAVGEAHIAAIKKSSKAMVEDAAVRAVHKVMAEFEAKLDERLMEQPAQQEPFGYFRYDLRLDAWVQNRVNNKGVAFYMKEQK